MGYHKDLSGDNMHAIYRWQYADAAARTGASGLLVEDIGKVARQLDDNSFWILVNNVGPVWYSLSLPDYQIGNYTVQVRDELGTKNIVDTGGITYASYIKLGQQVQVDGRIDIQSGITDTDNAYINLPFPYARSNSIAYGTNAIAGEACWFHFRANLARIDGPTEVKDLNQIPTVLRFSFSYVSSS